MVLLLHTASTLYMVGLIWFVQVVHYPLHGHVGTASFTQYQHLHMNWTGYVVGPAMLVEALTAVLLIVNPIENIPSWLPWLGAGLLSLIWASTGLLQVPLHNGLLEYFDPSRHRNLVLSNWIRTICWTARGVLVLYILHLMLPDLP